MIFHTDHGRNYRSKSFGNYVEALGVTQSFLQAYLPYDNSVMESFFSSLKREELYRTKYRSEKELRTAIYNCRQGDIHSADFSDEFNKLLDIVSETADDEMRVAYKTGFKDGVALMREVQE